MMKKRKPRRTAEEEQDDEEEEEYYMDDDEDDDDGENVVEEEALEAAVDDEAAKRAVLARVAADEAAGGERLVAWDPRSAGNDEQLECDPRAYEMLHQLHVEWPCLSFDVVPDELGGGRSVLPHELTLACGTQAGVANENRLWLYKVSNLTRLAADDDDDDRDFDDDEDDDDGEPRVACCGVAHPGTVNRVVCHNNLAATFSDDANVRVWDLRAARRKLEQPTQKSLLKGREAATLAHDAEGYALAWAADGRLATGDCAGFVKTFAAPTESVASANSWRPSPQPVEDVAWSPTEATVLMSVGCDRALRVWDCRSNAGSMLSRPDAHSNDVNCMAWNSAVSYLVASAGDDGDLKVWDLRAFAPTAEPVGRFDYHRGHPVASCQWDPHDESAIALAAADNTVTLWDLSVEDDRLQPQEGDDDFAASLPPQLLFIHQGLTDPKEAKHHPQIPRLLITTAADGLSFFIPALEGKKI